MLLTNGTRQVITMQGLHVLDLERVEVQIVEAKKRNGILNRPISMTERYENTHDAAHINIETQRIRLHEISTFLNGTNVLRMLRCLREKLITPFRVGGVGHSP